MSSNTKATNYVSRAGYKLEQANTKFKVDFSGRLILDIGCSTGGFTDYALKHHAKRVTAIELGTRQLSEKLRYDERIELLEKTDILNVGPYGSTGYIQPLSFIPDILLMDLSFISVKKVLPHVYKLVGKNTQLIILVKPQFEATNKDKHGGIVKNEAIRRRILHDFELWVRRYLVIQNKTDTIISGTKGNKERFYLLSISSKNNRI
ncbi:MAG: SAM-dependent methyltransferase [Candidatus Saccharimonadales bacterium]